MKAIPIEELKKLYQHFKDSHLLTTHYTNNSINSLINKWEQLPEPCCANCKEHKHLSCGVRLATGENFYPKGYCNHHEFAEHEKGKE